MGEDQDLNPQGERKEKSEELQRRETSVEDGQGGDNGQEDTRQQLDQRLILRDLMRLASQPPKGASNGLTANKEVPKIPGNDTNRHER